MSGYLVEIAVEETDGNMVEVESPIETIVDPAIIHFRRRRPGNRRVSP